MPRTRKSGEGGLFYNKARDLWMGVVDVGFDENGKRKQKRVSSRSQTVARLKLDKIKSEIENHGSPLGNQTVAEWGALWLQGYKYQKPQTYRTYSSLLKNWVMPAIGRKNIKEVRPSDINRIYDKLRAAGKSSSTSAKVHTMMSGMFEGAVDESLVSSNVIKKVNQPPAAKTDRDTFTPQETLAILQAATTVRHGSKWIISLYAGIRQGERTGATIDSVDLNTGHFTIQWNLVEGNYEHGCDGTCSAKAAGHCPQKRLLVPEGIDVRVLKGRLMLVPPKSGEPRTFPLLPQLAVMLEKHIAELALQTNPHLLLWPAANGTPMSSRDDQAEWRSLLALAGIDRPTATTHWARHTAISDLTASGVPDRVIGEVVGHRSPGVTARYQHVSSHDAEDGMRKLGERRNG